MCNISPFAKHKRSYHKTWQQKDTAWVCFCCPFFHDVICICIQSLQKLCVSLMRSLMRLPPWTSNQGQGLRRIMKSPISSRSMGCFSNIAQCRRVRNPVLSWPPQLCRIARTIPLRLEPLQINERKYTSVSPDTSSDAFKYHLNGRS